ncbi:MAG: TonB-dependent receptor [Bacteroidota bacterium]
MKQAILLLFSMLLTSMLFGQRTVTGVVTGGDTGEPLIGATVQIKGTTTGAVTDFDGRYSLEVSLNDVIMVRYVGYIEQEIPVGDETVINFVLKSNTTLEEIVVVGYGEQKKESVVGAVSQTTGENIKQKTGGADLRNALTGLLPGVVTLQGSGIPGGGGFSADDDDAATSILIRGLSTWNGSGEPLVLVDGVERSMADIDPNQVEKISVLKDASATAVFGVKGANGVILITTKVGSEGRPQLTFETTQSASTISRIHRALDAPTTLQLQNNAIIHEVAIKPSSWAFYVPTDIIGLHDNQRYPTLFPDTDWYDEMTNDWAFAQKYNMNVSGGTKFVKYFGSLSYLHEGDVLRTEDLGQGYDPSFEYERFNFRSNLDFDITPTTRLSVKLAGYYGQQQRPDGNKFQFWKGVYGMPPTAPVIFEDGTYSNLELFDRFDNSVLNINFGGIDKENRAEVNTDFILDQRLDAIIPGLSFNARVAFDNLFLTRGRRITDDLPITRYVDMTRLVEDPRFSTNMPDEVARQLADEYAVIVIPAESTSGYNYVKEPFSVVEENVNDFAKNNLFRSLFYQASLNYSQTFSDIHNVTGLVLFNRREDAKGSAFANFREDWVGRITYDYNQKYLLEVNGAYNGSEKFGRDNRFGFFPSVAVGWVPSKEPFFAPLRETINKLKFRYSNGVVGNDQGIQRWLYVGGYNITADNWQFGDPFLVNSPYPWRLEGTIPNPVIQWETAQKQNFGVEIGLFNSDLQIIADYFWESRTDMFLEAGDRNVPVVFGAPPVGINAGEVELEGYEVEVKYNKAFRNGLGFFVNANMAFVKDEVIFREDPELTPEYQKQAGYQINQTRTLINQPGFIGSWDDVYTHVGGLINIERLPGDFSQIDYNADGVIDPDDVVPYGYPSRPQYTYGVTFGGTLGGFTASVQFYGAFNVNYNLAYGEFFQNNPLAYQVHLDEAWSPEFGNLNSATLPHLRFDTGNSDGEYWQNDKSYLKLQNVEISYTLGRGITERLGLQGARIFASGNNLAIWSDMLEDRDRPRRTNRDYPLMRRVNLGLNLSF